MTRMWPFVLLVGCDVGWSVEGQWTGSCAIDGTNTADRPFIVSFLIDVREDSGDVLSGSGEFDYGQKTFEGTISGDRFDSEVYIEVDGDHGGDSVRLEIFGALDGDQIEGNCAFYGVDGSLEMSRITDQK